MEKKKIPAVFKEDIKKVLQSIGLLSSIENGDCVCKYCSRTISLENIQLIIPKKNHLFDFVCNNPTCIKEYNKYKSNE
jgi:aspartate carbamoyltransferase regulatory subunit